MDPLFACDLQVTLSKPMTLYCDNKVAFHITANSIFHEHTKHIEMDCHLVCDQILSNNLCTSHIHSIDQVVDLFTKALANASFQHLLGKLGILQYHAPI